MNMDHELELDFNSRSRLTMAGSPAWTWPVTAGCCSPVPRTAMSGVRKFHEMKIVKIK